MNNSQPAWLNARKRRNQEARTVMSDKLTPEQIEYWRKVLLLQFGSYTLIMPEDEIQAHRDRIHKLVESKEGEDNGTQYKT